MKRSLHPALLLRLCISAGLVCAGAVASGAHAADVLATPNALRIDHAVATPSLKGVPNGKGLLEITNTGTTDDRLVGIASPVSAEVQLHSMKNEDGVMRMRETRSLLVPAGRGIDLHGAGLHLMFMGLKQPLVAGEKFPVTLTFDRSGPQTVVMEVAPSTLMAPDPAKPATH